MKLFHHKSIIFFILLMLLNGCDLLSADQNSSQSDSYAPIGIVGTTSCTVSYQMSARKNKRPYQEDRFTHIEDKKGNFFGIYDGHGGDKTSSYLSTHLHQDFINNLQKKRSVENALNDSFLEAEIFALQNYSDGSTALVVYIDKNNVLHCAWAGDTRAVLEKNNTFMMK